MMVVDLSSYMDEDYLVSTFEVDCLLPNGIIITLSVERDATIFEIKANLWKDAQKYPLYSLLKDKNSYVFTCVLQNAEKVELVDESKLLWDVKPFKFDTRIMLKVVEKIGNEAEKKLNGQISILLDNRLHEFDNIRSAEVSDFRIKMKKVCENTAKERDSQSWLKRALCLYPPDYVDGIPPPLQEFLVEVYTESLSSSQHTSTYSEATTVETHGDAKPIELVEKVLGLYKRKFGLAAGDGRLQARNFVLKVCGRQEYLLGDEPLARFKDIQKRCAKGDKPCLVLVNQETVLAGAPPTIPPKRNTMTPISHQNSVPTSRFRNRSLWDFPETTLFSLQIHTNTNVQVDDFTKFQLKACLYHGPDAITDVLTSEPALCRNQMLTWNKPFNFNIALCNIPRMARLCFLLEIFVDKKEKAKKAAKHSSKKGNQDVIPDSWVNIPLFDYQGVLRSGMRPLFMWPVTDADILSEEELNPIGTVEDNPLIQTTRRLDIEFLHYNHEDGQVTYPDFEEVLSVANKNSENVKLLLENKGSQQQYLSELRKIIDKDPLATLHENEKQTVWRLRFECRHHYPNSLPKLLNCVQWNNREDVAMMQSLLQVWNKLPPEQALELLDFAYADRSVRRFAVECIQALTDAELLQYLLQLVQVLKYESYLDCDLVDFLLDRALKNTKVGHQMFWLLKGELHLLSVGVRFGLILEAYLRGNIMHLGGLVQQVEAVQKFKQIGQALKKKAVQKPKEELQNMIRGNPSDQACLKSLICTLDPSYKLDCLVEDKCSVMDSKMRPLWLVWKNFDPHGDPVTIMYKDGDDLRQDMLTLQILRIMDKLWQDEDLDLNLNAYGCLPTGDKEGFIEMVTESMTISNIQKDSGALKIKNAFNRKGLYDWLKKHNDTDEKMENAIERFSLSCAGYCVATYVLGVADRHNDNILLKENGQLFHIDFGHFLGNTKSKMGFNRERVSFVLTTDYVYIIKGGENGNAKEKFERFEEICVKAFLILRRNTNLILTLFMMMVNTGIPELQSTEDVEFLKRQLKPDLDEEAARKHFKEQFKKALSGSWQASINNQIHNYAHH